VYSSSSWRRFLSQLISLLVSVRARYSASVLDRTTSFWSCDLQMMGASANLIRVPEVDLDVARSPAKSESVYALISNL